ncbi:DUF427 domain-containing protein [Rhodococcus qingshengii]|jgi:uncharacterized protein (DUF427 family)|uniref:DUF427 domain-containing protein n=2 Tax=cellular organisms TaxID=131567 RepID=UPI0009B6AC61
MPRAILDGTVLAESPNTVVIEGNHYFPDESVNHEHLTGTATETVCYWKGTARYYSAVVSETVFRDIAWYYPDPSQEAASIKNYVAFGRPVQVEL